MNSLQTCPICKLGLNDGAEQCPRCGWDLTDTIGPPEAVGAELQARAAEARRRWDERREEELARRAEELKRREEEIGQEKERTRQQEEAQARRAEELTRRAEEIRQKEGELRQREEALARREEETSRPRQALGPFVDLGMEFVLIPAGEFLMGSPDSDKDAGDSEKPQHKIIISQPFYLGKYAVTQAQWMAVMWDNPSAFKGRSNPVENVSWDDVQVFIKKLNQPEGGNKYRLPTEAEWEYAARAGTTGVYSFGRYAEVLGYYAWYEANSGKTTHPVGQKEPNPWGLYDMYGNVWEWTQDWYGNYAGSPATDPRGPSSGSLRVFRGGAWSSDAGRCRSARRVGITPEKWGSLLGFRLAFSPGQ
jgi:formylglycine-generating enzyme required for sulfatase activity